MSRIIEGGTHIDVGINVGITGHEGRRGHWRKYIRDERTSWPSGGADGGASELNVGLGKDYPRSRGIEKSRWPKFRFPSRVIGK